MLGFTGFNTFEKNHLYRSETLEIQKISKYVFVHTSFLQTSSFGKVPCNGIVVVDGSEAVVFDTPTDNSVSLELIDWIEKELKARVKTIVPTHFHDDCLGGLEAFHSRKVASIAYQKTIDLARADSAILPKIGFSQMKTLKVGNKKINVEYLGEGHTSDNVIAYFPHEKILFGGCLIKETGAGKGYLADANVEVWPQTVQKVRDKFADVKIVVPGHGKWGGIELLDYTIQLFKSQN
jgi:metallo-beta-lactamase class B